jgi:peptidyl-prolyl cis-trans isomerase C
MRLFDASDRQSTSRPSTRVRVNGVEISQAAIAREIQNHPADTPGAAREQAARALVVRELLMQEARRQSIEVEDGSSANGRREARDEALVRVLVERGVDVPTPTEEECRRFYDANRRRFRSPDIYEAAHILFAARRDDREGYAAADKAARNAIETLLAEPQAFPQLAAALSACPSGKSGGNLGQVTVGQTVPEFEAALAALDPGTLLAEPVHSPYGAHVIRLDRKIEGSTLPFEAVGKQIADYLADAVFHRAAHQYIAILAGRAEIEGIELTAARDPLVR